MSVASPATNVLSPASHNLNNKLNQDCNPECHVQRGEIRQSRRSKFPLILAPHSSGHHFPLSRWLKICLTQITMRLQMQPFMERHSAIYMSLSHTQTFIHFLAFTGMLRPLRLELQFLCTRCVITQNSAVDTKFACRPFLALRLQYIAQDTDLAAFQNTNFNQEQIPSVCCCRSCIVLKAL